MTSTGSEPVSAVNAKTSVLMVHSRQSRRSVIFTSSTAAIVMIAITAGAMP